MQPGRLWGVAAVGMRADHTGPIACSAMTCIVESVSDVAAQVAASVGCGM